MICYDLRFPVWARSKKTSDQIFEYDLLVYVANWPDTRIDAWDTLLKARAIENQSYSVGSNRVGVDKSDKKYNGHSGVYSPMGERLCFSNNEEVVLTASLSANNLMDYRKRFPFQKDADAFKLK